jgi:hypothetical protein
MTHYSNTGNPIDFPKLSTIDKLWGQALDRVVPDTYSSLSLTQVEKVKTVFAELIVRECIGIADSHRMKMDSGPTYIIEDFKKHFGVEL